MKISVIIPTLGRCKEPIDTVRLLTSQTLKPDEIIVVDQNNPSYPELDQYLASVPEVQHIKSNIRGVTRNMNAGLHRATGEIVLFVDDDVLPNPDLIERHLENYARDQTLGGVAGRIRQPGDLDPTQISAVGQYFAWTGGTVGNFNFEKKREVDIAQGANMSFRRDVLLKAGGFDLGFDGTAYHFETDVCLRVKRAGYRIVFDPRAELEHLQAPGGGARMPDKSISTYYFVKNGLRVYQRHSPALGRPFYMGKMLGYVFAKAAYNRQPKIFTRGLRAIWDGIRQPMDVQSN